MKINCIVIDDEPLARTGIIDYIQKVKFLNLVGEFKSALEAKRFLEDHPVDLMFLDINMPKMSGLEFLRSIDQPPKVIFTTAYREYATESYDLDGVDYLVKPIAFDRFLKAANKLYDLFDVQEERTGDDHFFVRVDGVIKRVLLENLCYIEGMKDYVKIIQANSPELITLVSLKQMEQRLPEKFIRVHRSFIVAIDKVEEIEGNMLKVGGNEIPMAPQLRSAVLEKIMGGKFLKR
ncbi:LytR/AlgR family response regulator transcription factor [Roseivirga sp.]|uniref:LytR/AlgR family response regulator transcription factor n=1 Tax=Roseivirga sp. TaxID=1964215 RepID=UPI003B8AB9D0